MKTEILILLIIVAAVFFSACELKEGDFYVYPSPVGKNCKAVLVNGDSNSRYKIYDEGQDKVSEGCDTGSNRCCIFDVGNWGSGVYYAVKDKKYYTKFAIVGGSSCASYCTPGDTQTAACGNSKTCGSKARKCSSTTCSWGDYGLCSYASAGTSCGDGKICDGSGDCVSCTPGSEQGNPVDIECCSGTLAKGGKCYAGEYDNSEVLCRHYEGSNSWLDTADGNKCCGDDLSDEGAISSDNSMICMNGVWKSAEEKPFNIITFIKSLFS